jgi:hypothetical protein
MTIKNKKAFFSSPAAGFDGVFDWDFLLPAFEGTKIQPMDFDAVVERRGHFLVFETKSGDVPIPEGQIYTLESAVKNLGIMLIVLRAKSAEGVNGWDFWHRSKSRDVVKQHFEGNYSDLVDFVGRWFKMASGGG